MRAGSNSELLGLQILILHSEEGNNVSIKSD